MNGKPITEAGHENRVKWANGFYSNMPDWQTARHCAISSQMLFVLKQCRSFFLLNQDVQGVECDRLMASLHRVIDEADGTTAITEALAPSAPKPFPKPPGF